ncbi:MAG: hypothetical protein ACI4KA_02800 [Oscillospiraceae bacterium]
MANNDKLYGILSYIPLIGLISIFMGKTPFVRHHANQGLVLFIFELICGAAVTVLSIVLGIIPIVGGFMKWLIGSVIGLVCLALIIYGIYGAATEKTLKLPVIGEFTIIK